MISRSQRIMGLDIGSNSVKGIELAKTGDRFTVTGYAQKEISAVGTLKDAIAAVIREGRFKSKQVVSSVSGRSVIVRYINTPFMKPEELKASMKFEADKYIPFDVNEVILDCVPLDDVPSKETGEMRVLLVAVKKEVVDEHVRVLQEVGLYPFIVDVDCFALGNAFEAISETGADFLSRMFEDAQEEEEQEGAEESPYAEDAQEVLDEAEAGSEEQGEALETPEEEIPAALEESSFAFDTETPAFDEVMESPVLDEGEAAESVETESELPEEAAEEPEYKEGMGDLGGLMPDLAEGSEETEDAETTQESEASADEPKAGDEAPEIYALVDIGAQKTNINIMQGTHSYFTREVYVGGEDLTEAIAKYLGISHPEAETVKREGDQEAAVIEAVTQTLDDLANEIFLSFDYFENQFDAEIEKVYLSGGGCRLRGITSVLSQTLGRTVQVWDPLAGMDVSLAEPQVKKLRENAPQLAVAMGLASRLRKV